MFKVKTDLVFIYEITGYFVSLFYVCLIGYGTFSKPLKRSWNV